MKPQSFIAIGGCHVEGFGARGKKSFVKVFEELTSYTAACTRGTFALKKAGEINTVIQEHDPEIILLQLGNYEFHASIKKMIKSGNGSQKSSAKSTASKTSLIKQKSGQAMVVELPAPKKVGFFNRYLIMPFIFTLQIRKNKKFLEEVKTVIKNNPQREFIMVAPLPCLKATDNFIRSKAGLFMKRFLSDCSNVNFINLHGRVPQDKRLFYDPFHFNAFGHKKIGHLIASKLQIVPQQKLATAAM